MNKFLKKKWVVFTLPFSSVLYLIVLILLAYNTFMYDFVINSNIGFGILYVLFNALMFTLMYLSRKSKLTSLVSNFLPLVTFLILIFAFGNVLLILPLFLVSVAMLFLSKGNETRKTIIGTIYLLLYVLGTVAYILVNSFFGDKIKGTILTKSNVKSGDLSKVYTLEKLEPLLENSVSPDKKYRFYIVDIDNKLHGEIQIVVEPNNLDKNYGLFTLREKGRRKIVGFVKSRGDDSLPTVKWVENNKLEYKFPVWPQAKHTVITKQDVEKDYFSFLFNK